MIQVLVRVRVEDLPRFVSVFATRGASMRARYGSMGSVVMQHVDDPARLVLLLDFEDREDFEAFVADPEVQATMKAGGTVEPPEVTFLHLVGEFPH